MPFPGYPLGSSFTNYSPQSTDHPNHHNAVAVAANDLQAQLDALSTLVTDHPVGVVAYAQVTANQASITTVVDLTGLTVTWTAVNGRSYKITGSVLFSSSVANDVASLQITDPSNTVVQAGNVIVPLTNGVVLQRSVNLSTLNGSVTYKLRALRNAGTGNITMQAAAAFPAYILVEDMGVL